MRNPFRRKQNQTIAELESYYATQGRTSGRGRSWLMAIISLLVTVLVIVALFFGIRWIYRAVTDDSGSNGETTSTVDGDGNVTIVSGESGDPRSEDDVVVGTLNPDGTTTGSESDSQGVVTDEAASTSRDVAGDSADGSTDSSQNGSTTSQAGADGEIPNTGPGETVAFLLIATTAVGYLLSRRYQTR